MTTSTTLERLLNAGRALSNCAFNLKQLNHRAATERERLSLGEAQAEWDAAMAAYNAANRVQQEAPAAPSLTVGERDDAQESAVKYVDAYQRGHDAGWASATAHHNAQPAAQAEPVEVEHCEFSGTRGKHRVTIWSDVELKAGTKLYATPPSNTAAQGVAPCNCPNIGACDGSCAPYVGQKSDSATKPALFDLTEARTIVVDAIRQLRAAHVPVARLERMAETFLEATHAAAKTDEMWDQTLRERDRYHEIADDLAQAIAKHLGVEIGEHSSANCPWEEALEALAQAPAAEPQWQPIETAPMEGTPFWGYRERDGKQATACRVPRDDCEMWSFGGSTAAIDIAPELKPSYWMPLPAPPEPQERCECNCRSEHECVYCAQRRQWGV
jgi:hypothetical protein